MRPDWTVLAKSVRGRTPKQCRERWFNHLDPNVNKGPWTPEEDQIIWEAQLKMGNRWSSIARMLKGRTENAVKIRWKSLKRQKNGGAPARRKRRSPKSKSRSKSRPRSSSTQKAAKASYRNRMKNKNSSTTLQPRALPGIPESMFPTMSSTNFPLTSSPEGDPLWFTGNSGALLLPKSPGFLSEDRMRLNSMDMMSGSNVGNNTMTPSDNLLNRSRGDTRDSVAGLLELLDEVDTPSVMAMDTDTPTTQLNNLDPKDIFGPTSEEKIADLIMSRSNQTSSTNVSASPSQNFLSEADVTDFFRGKGW